MSSLRTYLGALLLLSLCSLHRTASAMSDRRAEHLLERMQTLDSTSALSIFWRINYKAARRLRDRLGDVPSVQCRAEMYWAKEKEEYGDILKAMQNKREEWAKANKIAKPLVSIKGVNPAERECVQAASDMLERLRFRTLSDADAWVETQRADTTEAYDEYLKWFPDGSHIMDAKHYREDCLARIALAEGTVDAYERFLASDAGRTYYNRGHVEREYARLSLQEALTYSDDGTRTVALETWIQKFPDAEDAHFVRSEITRLRYSALPAAPGVGELRRFSRENAGSPEAATAEKRIWATWIRQGTEAEFAAYLQWSAANPGKAEAQANDLRAEDAVWALYRAEGTESAARRYLSAYPKGRHNSEARRIVADAVDARKTPQERYCEAHPILCGVGQLISDFSEMTGSSGGGGTAPVRKWDGTYELLYDYDPIDPYEHKYRIRCGGSYWEDTLTSRGGRYYYGFGSSKQTLAEAALAQCAEVQKTWDRAR